MQPAVSVCLPVFNGERFLSFAIESILAQTESDFELIIIDDFSSDASWKIIQDYASRERRIKCWQNESNLGLFKNYNVCMQQASGKFIKLFAQDDWLAPTALARSIAVLEINSDVSLVSIRRTIIDESGNDISAQSDIIHFDSLFPGEQVVSGKEIVRKSLLPVTNFIGEPSAVMFRASLANHTFDTSLHHLGDLDLWLRLIVSGKMFFISESLCHFRVHKEARSRFNTRTLLFMVDLLTLGRKFVDCFESMGFSEEKFLKQNLRALVEQVGDWLERDRISIDVLREQHIALAQMYSVNNERSLVDAIAFRDLAFLALALAAETNKHMEERARTYSRRVRVLERKIHLMLSSYSWKSTKVLRDLHVFCASDKMLASNEDLGSERQFSNSDCLYIDYLEQHIREIKSSRSWRLTSPLRVMSKLSTK